MADQAERPTWAIAVHGGAHRIRPGAREAHQRGCERAALAGQRVLEAGGPATQAVVAAIRVLEDDATFNAGYGSVLNSDGDVECDAALMDGDTLDFGGVAAVRRVRNPIDVAEMLLREETILLAGDGAERFADERGVELCEPSALIAPHEASKHDEATADASGHEDPGSDTVGCVAMDVNGHFAAGTSTGGLSGALPGRIGDSPLPGCGLYAEDGIGAVALSGIGERIARVTLAAWIMTELRSSDADAAARSSLQRLATVGGEAGAIVLDGTGRIGWTHNSPDFAVAHATSHRPVRAFTNREQDAEPPRADDGSAGTTGSANSRGSDG